MLDRRTLLQRLTALAAAAGVPGLFTGSARADAGSATAAPPARDRIGELLPTRKFGRHDEHITMLGLGGHHFRRPGDEDAQRLANAALEAGIRFVDTAESYQGGESERLIGRVLTPSFRDELYIMTKTKARTARQVARHLDGSRKRLAVDVIDLWQLHAIQSPEDVDRFFDRGGIDVFLEAREKGTVRHLGFTGHNTPAAFERMLDRLDELGVQFDAAQMPINLVDPGYLSFLEKVVPRLVEHGYAVLAMKTLAAGQFYGHDRAWANRPTEPVPRLIPDRVSLDEALQFVWSHPVATLISGMERPEMVAQNAAIARAYAGMDAQQRTALVEKVADAAGDTMEFYKAPGVG